MGFKRRKRQWANCPRQPWGGQVTSAPETAELAGLLFSAARPSPPHLSQRAPSLWTAVAVSWQTFCSTVSRSASKAWILLTKPFLFILLSLKFPGRISVSISSKIFINCSIVAFTLLSSLQRASACKSLARKPCGGMMHYSKCFFEADRKLQARH